MPQTLRRAVAIAVLSLAATLAPLAAAREPSRPQHSEELRYPSDPGVTIAATLEKPPAAGDRPVPVVVIVSGTGPWTRGGWVAMRARLHAAGIATLMFDKRGLGQSTGTFTDTIPEMQRDVAAAAAFLRTRQDIDPKRIALMGISQGAVAATLVAAQDASIGAVILLSGPVGPRGELFLGILRGHLTKAGKSETQIAEVTAAVAAWIDARSKGTPAAEITRLRNAAAAAFVNAGFPQDQAGGFVATLDNDVVLSMYDVAPDRALAQIRAPTLAIYGSSDEIIAPFPSLEAATQALSANPDAVVVAVPGMTHELQRARPIPREAPPPADGTMPVVLELVGT